jgi:hypothetical protein
MADNEYERSARKLARFTDWHAGHRIYRGGWPIEQCQNDDQREGWMAANTADADAETASYLAKHPQAVAA